MASTFTLKRKTYTEFDYNNDIASAGFRDGINYAMQKMYGVPRIFDEAASRMGFRDGYDFKSFLRGRPGILGNTMPKNITTKDLRNTLADIGKDPKWAGEYAKVSKMYGLNKPVTGQAVQGNFGQSLGRTA